MSPARPPGWKQQRSFRDDAWAAARQPGGSPLRMPRWTDRGPYRLDLDGMLDQAREAVLARPDLRAQLGVLQDPPDLTAVITGQRELILAGIPGLESRANRTAFKLRDLLFASLVSDPDQGEEAGFLTSSIGWLATTIETLETWARERCRPLGKCSHAPRCCIRLPTDGLRSSRPGSSAIAGRHDSPQPCNN